jgi:hypothetical protein
MVSAQPPTSTCRPVANMRKRSGVLSCWMMVMKAVAVGFTHSRMGNSAPVRCRPKTVRVLLMKSCNGARRQVVRGHRWWCMSSFKENGFAGTRGGGGGGPRAASRRPQQPATFRQASPERTDWPVCRNRRRYIVCAAASGCGMMVLMSCPTSSRLLYPNMERAAELALSTTPSVSGE